MGYDVTMTYRQLRDSMRYMHLSGMRCFIDADGLLILEYNHGKNQSKYGEVNIKRRQGTDVDNLYFDPEEKGRNGVRIKNSSIKFHESKSDPRDGKWDLWFTHRNQYAAFCVQLKKFGHDDLTTDDLKDQYRRRLISRLHKDFLDRD